MNNARHEALSSRVADGLTVEVGIRGPGQVGRGFIVGGLAEPPMEDIRQRGRRLSDLSIRYHRASPDRPTGFIVAVVDDDQRILESLENLLESAWQAVRLFGSAAALLESGGLTEIDCLVSDIDLPKIDGFELLRLVYAARPELTVILITGHPELVHRSPPIGSGPYRLFKKPFDGQELLTAVSDAQRKDRCI